MSRRPARRDPEAPAAGQDSRALTTPPRPDFHLSDDLDAFDALAGDMPAGPIALDVERASGIRYPDRAFLVQMCTPGGTAQLLDPETPGRTLGGLAPALSERTVILHAAHQDLPSLRELGVAPSGIIDTELAGRVLGLAKVNLGFMVGEFLGIHLDKAYSAADWSRRPLPEKWLTYAADDVVWLHDLVEILTARLHEVGRLEWFDAECAHLATQVPDPPSPDRWRRTSHITTLRGGRQLARARALWTAREQAASEYDIAPKRLLTDKTLIAAARLPATDTRTLRALEGFTDAERPELADTWIASLTDADELPRSELPTSRGPLGAHPPHSSWKRVEPSAARLLSLARAELTALSEDLDLAHELILKPSTLRLWVWTAVTGASDAESPDAAEVLDRVLRTDGARDWQIDLVTPRLLKAQFRFLHDDEE